MEDISDDYARDEIIARACEDMLSMSEEGRYVYVGRFTKSFVGILKKYIEIKNYPIVMNYRDAYLSMEAKERGKYHGEGINYHNLGVDGLASALKSFDSPEYILLSTKENKIELILEGRDYKNRQLFSIVEVNTKAHNTEGFLDAHVVTSVYGKSGLKNRIELAKEEKRLVYDKKNEELSQGIPQVQYEGNINDNSSFDNSILNPNEKVKENFSDRENINGKDVLKEQYSDREFNEHSIETALWEAFDHNDKGHDNLIRVSKMPEYIVEKFGIEGDFYIYHNHSYENMVSEEQAIQDGRPTMRHGEKIHFHNLGIERVTNALLSVNSPTMTISAKSKDGNPTLIMILNQFGNNNAPLYGVISFYSNKEINGSFDKKPHIVLTIAERDFFKKDGRVGYNELIRNAIKEGRVLDFDIKKRDDLSVIAKSAGLGNITRTSLENSLTQFLKEVKAFKKKITFSIPTEKNPSLPKNCTTLWARTRDSKREWRFSRQISRDGRTVSRWKAR